MCAIHYLDAAEAPVDVETPHWLPYLEDPSLGFEFVKSFTESIENKGEMP